MKNLRQRLETSSWTVGNHDQQLEKALLNLNPKHHELLHRCFKNGEAPTYICQMMGIPISPATCFVDAFRDAEKALEKQLERMARS